MMTFQTITLVFLISSILTSCKTEIAVDEKDKIFHAGPSGVNDGWDGGIYFGLYKDNKYEFCDGDFMDPGCYTGLYSISGDTIVLQDLKKHDGIPTNRFIIRRYGDMDSNYWAWKYPNTKTDWKTLRHTDSLGSSTGDVFPLDEENKINLDDNYFLIRLDSLKNNH